MPKTLEPQRFLGFGKNCIEFSYNDIDWDGAFVPSFFINK